MRSFTRNAAVWLSIAAVISLAATGSFASPAQEDVQVGTLMTYTGALREFGPKIHQGAELAANQLTAAGLSINLLTEDTETNPIAAASAARKLVDLNRVVAIVGALASSSTMSAAESVTIPNSVVLISPASTSPAISDLPADRGRDFLFRSVPSDALQGRLAGTLAAARVGTASILYVNNPYGLGLAENFSAAFEAAGGAVLAMVPHDETPGESYTAELRQALAGDPDVLAAYSYPQHAKIYLKEAIEFYQYGAFLFADGTKSQELIDEVGAANLEGLMGTAPGSAGGAPRETFISQYEEAYGEKPPLPFIENAYDAMAVVGLAAFRARANGAEVTGTSVRDNLRAVASPPGEVVGPGDFARAFALIEAGEEVNYEGAAGSMDFDDAGDVVTPIEVWRYAGGTIESLYTQNVE